MAYVYTCLDSRQRSFYETIHLKLNGFGWERKKSETKWEYWQAMNRVAWFGNDGLWIRRGRLKVRLQTCRILDKKNHLY